MADTVAAFFWSLGGLPRRGQVTVPDGFDPEEFVKLYIASVNKARPPDSPLAIFIRMAPNG